MAKKLEHLMEQLPARRRAAIKARAGELATLKDLRQAVAQTQQDLAVALGVGQDTISRLEKRSDMLLSTLRRYVEAMGGTLERNPAGPRPGPGSANEQPLPRCRGWAAHAPATASSDPLRRH